MVDPRFHVVSGRLPEHISGGDCGRDRHGRCPTYRHDSGHNSGHGNGRAAHHHPEPPTATPDAIATALAQDAATRAAGPTRPPTATPKPIPTLDPTVDRWWNDAVFYEVFVRSFQDSDGDGIGDINGLIERLDYLQELGVTALWLMPIMESPSYHGYDVVDYYTVEQDYGTNEDFQRLIEEAHKRGIRVTVDLVVNHTSTENPWFIAANSGDPAYRDWYVWADPAPDYLGPGGSGFGIRGKMALTTPFLVGHARFEPEQPGSHGSN